MSSYVERLTKLSTCDVADGLLNRYRIADGGYFANLTQWSGQSSDQSKSVVGRAYTVLFAPIDDPRPPVNYIDGLPEGCFLVIALAKSLQHEFAPYVKITQACYGGLMSTRAQYQNAVGSVIFGRIRDVDEHRNLGYPVFSYGLGACAPKEAVKPVAVGIPLEIISVDGSLQTINPDDYIVGDEHGIVRVPGSKVNLGPLIEYIERSVDVDELVSQDIKAGVPAKQAQNKRREVLKRMLELAADLD